jgi:diguanylate cyclase (GGDEF)-like protein
LNTTTKGGTRKRRGGPRSASSRDGTEERATLARPGQERITEAMSLSSVAIPVSDRSTVARGKPARRGRVRKKSDASAKPTQRSSREPTFAAAPVDAGGRYRRLAISESGRTNQVRATEVARALGYEVVCATATEVRRAIRQEDGPDVVLAGLPGAERLIGEIGLRGEDRTIVIASMSGPADAARETCLRLGADLFTVRPHTADGLATVLFAASRLAAERERVRALREQESGLRDRLQRYGEVDLTTGFQHIDFFKHVLVMELKRARRYGYSLALVMVAIDPRPTGASEPSPEATRKLRTRVAAAISSSIRDIDLPVDLSQDRLLVLLPYTDLSGATAVGKRVARAVRSYGFIKDGPAQKQVLSVSIGVAALKPGRPASFARLFRDAGAALRAAQLKGGGRVVVRT